jgi:hypothetical protein
VKYYDNETADDTRSLQDRAFLAAMLARGDGYLHTAKALDAIVDELSARSRTDKPERVSKT